MADLVTTGEVEAQLTGLTATQQTALPALISAASAAVETYCRRRFAATDYDERYSSDATGRLFLKSRPVISITSVSLGTKSDTSPSVIAPSAYDFDPSTGEVVTGSGDSFWSPYGFGAGWGWDIGTGGPAGRFRDVRVVYRAGFEPADIPADVRLATILTVRSLLGGVARDPTVSSQSQGGRSVSYAAGAQQTLMGGGLVADLLGQWRSYR
jgi:hypothetical protein